MVRKIEPYGSFFLPCKFPNLANLSAKFKNQFRQCTTCTPPELVFVLSPTLSQIVKVTKLTTNSNLEKLINALIFYSIMALFNPDPSLAQSRVR
jgi:hypothetical protein